MESVTTKASMAWCVRSGWVEPRICVLDEAEVDALRQRGISAGGLLVDLQRNVTPGSITAGSLEYMYKLETGGGMAASGVDTSQSGNGEGDGDGDGGGSGGVDGDGECDGQVSGAVSMR